MNNVDFSPRCITPGEANQAGSENCGAVTYCNITPHDFIFTSEDNFPFRGDDDQNDEDGSCRVSEYYDAAAMLTDLEWDCTGGSSGSGSIRAQHNILLNLPRSFWEEGNVTFWLETGTGNPVVPTGPAVEVEPWEGTDQMVVTLTPTTFKDTYLGGGPSPNEGFLRTDPATDAVTGIAVQNSVRLVASFTNPVAPCLPDDAVPAVATRPGDVCIDLSTLTRDMFFYREGQREHEWGPTIFQGVSGIFDFNLFNNGDDESDPPFGPNFVDSNNRPWVLVIEDSEAAYSVERSNSFDGPDACWQNGNDWAAGVSGVDDFYRANLGADCYPLRLGPAFEWTSQSALIDCTPLPDN